jgi:hypothetical protein
METLRALGAPFDVLGVDFARYRAYLCLNRDPNL